jgi:Protein of unknown function (DUF3048) N-terminal domain/Protein of unknown function (DUF3048) C-terminal domain
MTSSVRARAIALGLVAVVVAGVVFIASTAGLFSPAASSGTPGSPAAIGSSGAPSASGPSPSGEPGSPSPEITPSPSPTPVPTPVMAVAPLDGLLTTPAKAKLHPIAVMIDDLSPARLQSGFSSASVVWQAPAEGGIPRYMMMFQENTPPGDVGPVRSSRYYYIAWAAEWRAAYVHAGGSPQALATLRAQGHGQLVFDANQFYNGAYFRRVTIKFPPHNLYTTGKQLRQLATKVGATKAPGGPVWKFAPDAPLEKRPVGGTIETDYSYNHIVYKYDRATNTYKRFVTGFAKQQTDPSTKLAVGPKNVIVMLMKFGPLNDGSNHGRLEATVTGKGTAWIATNGVTIKGTWRKKSLTAPTLFYDAAGHQVTLTAGQTFIQVMKTTDVVKFKAGKAPPPVQSPSPSPSGYRTSPSPTVDLRRPSFEVLV